MFQMGGVGPTMGQANVFLRYAPEKITCAIERAVSARRAACSKSMERQLAGQRVASPDPDHSIADIALWSWIAGYGWSGVSVDGLPQLKRWM